MHRFITAPLLILWIALCLIPVAIFYYINKPKWRGWVIQIASRGIVYLLGVRYTVKGEPSSHRPLLLVSNHISYIDIPLLSSCLDARFVPKKEIREWPVIGWICVIMGAVFVDRSVSKIEQGNDAIAQALASGDAVILFPEATTSDGKHMLPFKPAFFEAATGAVVQPVAIRYVKICGLPIDYGQWPLIAWYGDMELLPHLWKLISLGKIEAEIHFLPPIITIGEDRKSLAYQSHEAISAVLGETQS